MKKKNISIEIIEKWMESKDWKIRRAAMNACKGRTDIPISLIKKGMKDENWRVRQAAMLACKGRTDIPISLIEKGLKDEDCDVRQAAMLACKGRTDIPIEVIEKGLKDEDWKIRQAAMLACKGRTDIPISLIKKGLKDEDWKIRRAAMLACKGRTDIPLLRTIEPNENVYKKCLGGVIVVAEIPQTAQVRGGFNRKCRANESIIVDIIGDICGEKIGISIYDKTTMYEIGDHVVIENFDYSDEECSTGFHFFNTLEEAKNYDI